MADPYANMPPEQIASIQYQLEHIDDDRRPVILGATWALWALAFIAILLRFYAKNMVRSGFKAEDGTILLGFLGATGLVLNNTIATAHGGGLHLVRLSPSDILVTIKLLYGFQIIYTCTLVLIKFSILLFFYRTFGPNRTFRIAVYCVAALVCGWFIATLLASIFQCTPVSFFWNKAQPGYCFPPEPLVISTAIINVVYDFIIVAMPMPMIWRLDMPRSRKIGICLIFLLGAVVILASIVRLVFLHNLETYDLTYDTVDIGIWSAVEPNMGVVGACLPLMAPIFRKLKEVSTKRSYGDSNDSGWNHTRLEEDQVGALKQQQWPVKSPESGQPDHNNPDNAPLVRHAEWVQDGVENNSRQPNRVFELQSMPKRPTSHDLALR